MIISKRQGFLFIHIVKTAGTSMMRVFTKYDDRSFLLKFLNNKIFYQIPQTRMLNPYPFHITALELRTKLGVELYDSLFKFAFVRNPWDWNVSRYHFISQSIHHPKHRIVRKQTFSEFIEWMVKNFKVNQSKFVTDNRGKIIVDFVGKFEKLNEDFKYICKSIGIQEQLPHRNRSAHGHYRKYYNEHTIDLISSHHKEDIKRFEYEF